MDRHPWDVVLTAHQPCLIAMLEDGDSKRCSSQFADRPTSPSPGMSNYSLIRSCRVSHNLWSILGNGLNCPDCSHVAALKVIQA